MEVTANNILLLNFSYEPLNVVTLKRAVRLLYAKKAEIVHECAPIVRSEKISYRLPSVLRMVYFVAHRRKHVPLTKKNVLLRDGYTCGYCGYEGEREMTVDHVVPKKQGGPSTWTNLVASCLRCNSRKRDRTPQEAGMPLKRTPHVPRWIPWVVIRKHTMPNEWMKYFAFYNIGIEERVE